MTYKTSIRLQLCLALSVWIGASSLANACESHQISALLEQAKQASQAGNLNNAYLYVDRALRIDPSNLHARYSRALIMIKEGATKPSQLQSGLSLLKREAEELSTYKTLPSEVRNCAETATYYAIFNTIGVQYYLKGDLKNAEFYYLKGERNTEGLNDQRAKLYNNLALLYQNKLNLDKAAAYYQKAKQAGSPKAQSRVDAIRQIQGATPNNN